MISLGDYIAWAISEVDTTDTAEEKRKVRSLMRKRGVSESRAIAFLKANGGISKQFGNEKRKKK